MRKDTASTNGKDSSARGLTGSRGKTVLGTPHITSCGLFHQPRGSRTRESSTLASLPGQRRDNSIGGEGEQASMVMLERHTSAAKDGVIEVLTAKASKLGAGLERAVVARKKAEGRANKLQGQVQEEEAGRRYLEQSLRESRAETESLGCANADLRWEVENLRTKMREVEDRAKAWTQDETDRRTATEDTLHREHALAAAFLREVYPEDSTVEEAVVVELLVREARGLREALEERDAGLRVTAERLDELVSQLQLEQESRRAEQEQLAFAHERMEAARQKVRQLSGQLESEVHENEILRAKTRAADEELDRRAKAVEERKAKAQQRKRGDMRDAMAENKAKDDRIKALETTLMQERERLEGELQAARSDYEESAGESRRKTARLQKKCVELEYRIANPQKAQTGLGATATGGGSSTKNSAGILPDKGDRGVVTGGLISAAAMMPWRRGTETATNTTATTTTATALSSNEKARQQGSLSAARLPDPSRNNESAPAWMRSDLASDRIELK